MVLVVAAAVAVVLVVVVAVVVVVVVPTFLQWRSANIRVCLVLLLVDISLWTGRCSVQVSVPTC